MRCIRKKTPENPLRVRILPDRFNHFRDPKRIPYGYIYQKNKKKTKKNRYVLFPSCLLQMTGAVKKTSTWYTATHYCGRLLFRACVEEKYPQKRSPAAQKAPQQFFGLRRNVVFSQYIRANPAYIRLFDRDRVRQHTGE